jgi:hypothetical protein
MLMARHPMILCSKALRAVIACMFLLLAIWQPGLAAAATAAASESVAVAAASHDHGGSGVHEEVAGSAHEHNGGDHHQPASLDLCCEMHCVMSQAMPASSPLIHAPEAGGFQFDFTRVLPDGQILSVIKPPRTIS